MARTISKKAPQPQVAEPRILDFLKQNHETYINSGVALSTIHESEEASGAEYVIIFYSMSIHRFFDFDQDGIWP
jgi:hypothetical protein